MARLGDQLLSPEAGWQRINVNSEVITKSIQESAVNDYWYWVMNDSLKLQFNFKGSKLRIIAPTYADKAVIRVMIDGKEYLSTKWDSLSYVTIVFEKALAKREHYVQISPVMGTGTYMAINGFDIDSTGEMLPYREINNYHIYLKGGVGYGVQDGIFTKLTDNWESLTPADKKALFLSTNCEIASAADLVDLGKIKEIIYSEIEEKQSVLVKAAPKDQLVMPKGLISLDSFEGVDKSVLISTISGNGICKIIATTDLTTYQTYDSTAQEWKVVDHADLAAVRTSGIDVSQLQTIGRAAWDALTTNKSGIGFAYLLAIEDTIDVCAVDKLELQVDMKGSWAKAIHGTDYTYAYPANTILQVTLLSDGDYKINYMK